MDDQKSTHNGPTDRNSLAKDWQIATGTTDPPDYERQFDYRDEFDGLTIAIVEGIADLKDVPVTEVVPPLSDVVDPTALEQIFRPLPDGTQRAGWVTFYLHDCKVVVSSDGWIRIYDLETE